MTPPVRKTDTQPSGEVAQSRASDIDFVVFLRGRESVRLTGDGLVEAFAWKTEAGYALHVLNYNNPNLHRGWIRKHYPVGAQAVRMAIPAGVEVGAVSLLRAERDRFAFDPDGIRDMWTSATAVAGTDASMDALLLGLRAHHARGALRGHAALYAGVVRRTGRRASVTYWPPYYTVPYTVPWGEPDATNRAFGFGVGATWAIPRLPDLTAEARVIWLAEGPEAMIPLRVGVTLP